MLGTESAVGRTGPLCELRGLSICIGQRGWVDKKERIVDVACAPRTYLATCTRAPPLVHALSSLSRALDLPGRSKLAVRRSLDAKTACLA